MTTLEIINRYPIMIGMARQTDSFFIRANLIVEDTGGAGFKETELDLGAYVDALGKSVLKIHNVQVHMQDANNLGRPPLYNSGSGAEIMWQLTTQSNTAIVAASDRSVVSAGCTQFAAPNGTAAGGQLSSDAAGVNVQHFTDGYLIAVESIYLGAIQAGLINNSSLSVVLECTVESLTQSAAMALALSQQ